MPAALGFAKFLISYPRAQHEGTVLSLFRASLYSNCYLLLLLCDQLNISYPATGCQKVIEIEDESKL